LITHSSSPWPPEARRGVAIVQKWPEPRRSHLPDRNLAGARRKPS
jgi:hypothetical protein